MARNLKAAVATAFAFLISTVVFMLLGGHVDALTLSVIAVVCTGAALIRRWTRNRTRANPPPTR
jgi:hypothetical protein